MRFFLRRLPFYTYRHTRTPDAISIYCEQPAYNWENKKIETHNTQLLPAFIVFNLDFSLSFHSFFALHSHFSFTCVRTMIGVIYLTLNWMYDTANWELWLLVQLFRNHFFVDFLPVTWARCSVWQRQVNILCCHLSNRLVFAFYFNIISIRIDRRKKIKIHLTSHWRARVDRWEREREKLIAKNKSTKTNPNESL